MQNELIINVSNMKKVYMKPTMTVVMVQHQASILEASPSTYNEVSNNESYSRQSGGWDDDE